MRNTGYDLRIQNPAELWWRLMDKSREALAQLVSAGNRNTNWNRTAVCVTVKFLQDRTEGTTQVYLGPRSHHQALGQSDIQPPLSHFLVHSSHVVVVSVTPFRASENCPKSITACLSLTLLHCKSTWAALQLLF